MDKVAKTASLAANNRYKSHQGRRVGMFEDRKEVHAAGAEIVVGLG